MAAQTAVGRIGEPKELAYLVAFSASGNASYITGTTILIDGGLVRSLSQRAITLVVSGPRLQGAAPFGCQPPDAPPSEAWRPAALSPGGAHEGARHDTTAGRSVAQRLDDA